MKINFLGTNGWFPTPTGDTACILIDAKDQYVILDAGNGFYKIDQYIKEPKPISLFISHFHIDHVSGLHTLIKFDFPQGIDVYVGEGRTQDFQTFVNPPFTIGYKPRKDNVFDLKTEIRLHELKNGVQTTPFKMESMKQFHAYGGTGYRFELEGKTIAYTGDSGHTDEARQLAKDADLLICECTFKKLSDPDLWGHFDPIHAATLAKESNVKQLILTHFEPIVYATPEDRKWAEGEARKIFMNTKAATDGIRYEIL